MRRTTAIAVFAAMASLTIAALFAPPWGLVVMVLAAVAVLQTGRAAFLAFAGFTLTLNGILFAFFLPGESGWTMGSLRLGQEGALMGLVGGLRLVAMVAANLAFLSRFRPGPLVDGLRLPPRITAFVAALAIAGHDVGRDVQRMVLARRLDGDWPRHFLQRLPTVAKMLPAVLVAAVRRAQVRQEALRLIGHRTGPLFGPVLAVSAVAVAGRLALIALPNIALTYVVVFLGGLVFGARVGFLGGLLSMLVTDVLISGLVLPAFVNVPAMALLGFLGGLFRRFDFVGRSRVDRAAGAFFAATIGVLCTFVFSAAADTLTWALIPEYGHRLDALGVLVMAGLAFNVVPAVSNAVLFAVSVGPVVAAFRALGTGGFPGARAEGRSQGAKGQVAAS